MRRAVFIALLAGVGLLGLTAREHELGSARDLHAVDYVSSAECTRCHVDHAESFGRTFHRTMTRAARGADVRAPFSGEEPRYFGVPARMSTRADGTPLMQFGGGAVPEQTFAVALTVGSRRYQQYVAEKDGSLIRLPWAYHLEEQRWFHMNGAFLTRDPEPTARGIAAEDYLRHVTRWNDNCIFCHNVRPNPGMHGAAFESSVEEYGVACEACHGPAAAHASANSDPYRRYRLHLTDAADPTIVNPARLSQERSLDLCGRCHGQRITDDVSAFLHQGDPFVPGDDLSLYSAPLWRDTTLAGERGKFASRFWEDGTPRLTAYEYQGVLLSPCTAGGALTCLSCHDMHAGDPRGQLRPDLPGDRLCTQCHEQLAQPKLAAQHAHHAEGQARCVDCHMPNIVYGVMASHPSHRIELPEPGRDAARDRPDACTLCHVDQTRAWAIRARDELWKRPTSGSTPSEAWSQAEQQLLGGDPVARALTAASYARHGRDDARVHALLLEAMEHDDYPGVRHLAYRSLVARHPELDARYVPEDAPAERAAAVAVLRSALPHQALDPARVESERARAADRAIDIGE